MPDRPNILFLMTDQMQAQVLNEGHPCLTPNLDRLAARGVRFTRAYTPNAICSPARASLMTGLLPHNHGVLSVTHCFDEDQVVLREQHPHWAQRLADAGYRTGYFGKWHVEHSEDPGRFGWKTQGSNRSDLYRDALRQAREREGDIEVHEELFFEDPPGYSPTLFYRVDSRDAENRGIGITTRLAAEWLDEVMAGDAPWCCFASCLEPHDPFVCGKEAFDRYDVDAIEMPSNADDDLHGRPNLYKRAQGIFAHLTERQRKTAAACYYASITEIDAMYGRLLDKLDAAGQLDQTIVVFTTDHGEHLGAHGLYMKNIGAFEEVYNIPLIVAGPGIGQGTSGGSGGTTSARVGLHDLCPTLCELTGAEAIDNADSRSFASVVRDPRAHEGDFTTGFAEYHGGRQIFTQRICYDGPWKFIYNGFDYDELYHLGDDPHERRNLAHDEAYRERVEQMMKLAWRFMKETGDHTLVRTTYPVLRMFPVGPDAD